MLSMQNWLKSESEQNQNVLKATGTERKAYLEKWMVMQSREKKSKGYVFDYADRRSAQRRL